MARNANRAIFFVFLMVFATITPMIGSASAHSAIILTLDKPHIALQGGNSENITMTIKNNGSSIESYNIGLELDGLSDVWNITSVNQTVNGVLPTFEVETSFIVRLDIGAEPSDSGSFIINVSEQDSDIYSSITVYVTVSPSYASSISFNAMNGPLQQMNAGSTANFTIDVSNDGNAPDTILLDVDAEPDLAAFWANFNNNTGNNSNSNNSNNNSGGGSNNTSNNTSTNVTVPTNVLMYGNSYIYTNNVDSMLEQIFNSVGEHNSTISNTAGSMKLPQHWNNINTSGNTWNTSLRDSGHDWDYVVLQDQSQIPGYQRSNQEWIDSKDSAVLIADAVDEENSEVILMMTWGRRSGDPSNPVRYSNFTNMQDELASGYTDFHDNMTNPSRDVWIAPVGLAFQNIYYNVLDSGSTPTLPGNTFYDLYTSDGSHPSMTGSYLAACVLYATITGESSTEVNDSISIAANIKLELQQAADDTVFNQTSNIDYPWENGSQITSMSQNRVVPPGWNLVFDDSQMSNVPAYSDVQTTLQVSVPSNAQPGFYGFNLFSASTNGNNSNSYTFVVEVLPENNLSFSFLDQTSDFIPGQSVTTSLQVTNTGNSELDLNWNLTLLSGPCTVSLIDASTTSFMPGDVDNIGFIAEVDSSADKSHVCEVLLSGEGLHGDYAYDSEPFEFSINVDELIAFELGHTYLQAITLTPQNAESYQLRLYNNGSETIEFLLDFTTESPLTTNLLSSTNINVQSGQVGLWNLSTDVAQGYTGLISQNFSVTYQNITSNDMVTFDIQTVPGLAVSGPLDGRITTKPGSSVDVDLELTNSGTMDLNLTASVSGLPTGAEVMFSSIEVDLDAGNSETITMSVSMTSTAQSGSYPINVTYSSDEVTKSLNLELQVAESVGLTVNSISNNIAAGPISEVSYTFEVTNLGSASDTFFVSLGFDDSNNASTWFDTTLSTTSINLDSSSTQAVTIQIRERLAGAPVNGCDVDIVVTSSNDDTISSSISFKIIPIQASAQLTILSDDNSALPGQSISGDVVVTNTGTGEDQFLLTTVGQDCGLSEIFTLPAGSSSQAFEWSCLIEETASAGLSSFNFRVTSNARSNYVLEQIEIFTVEPNWGSDGIVEITFGDSALSMASSGGSSTTVTVKNLANAPLSGSLSTLGSDISLFDITIRPMNSDTTSNEFSLANGQTTVFELLIDSRVTESESGNLRISASLVIDGVAYTEESTGLPVMIDGPELPPNGIELPFGVGFDEEQTISIMAGGWVFSLLLLLLMNLLRKRRRKAGAISATVEGLSEDDSEDSKKPIKKAKEKEVIPHQLKSNECRMTPDNKVTCPFCQAKLGVPRGSEPPFKFTCPQCDKKIRVVENQKF